MLKFLSVLTAAGCLLFASPADARSRRSTSKQTHSTRRAVAKRGAAVKAKGKRRVARASRPSGPPRQMTPSPDRYAQIQQALAEKGYFTGPVNGFWGSDSVDALKRFQTDKSLTPDGRLGALTLTALGLGPNSSAAIEVPAKPEDTSQN